MAWSAGAILTAAQLNTYAPQEWTSYTPTWTASSVAPALGNGTIVGRYVQYGKTLVYSIELTFGSTTTSGTGFWTFSLPVNSAFSTKRPAGTGVAMDSGTIYVGVAALWTVSSVVCIETGGSGNAMSGTVPFTFATGDSISLTGTYEAA